VRTEVKRTAAVAGDLGFSIHPCDQIVDLDQVEAIEIEHLAFHEDLDERNNFTFLLNQTLRHQVRTDLEWDKEGRLLYFRARAENECVVPNMGGANRENHGRLGGLCNRGTSGLRVANKRSEIGDRRFAAIG